MLLLLIFFVLVNAREWTVMVYMAADNSLAAMADSDLIEMKAIGSNDDLAIIVQVDKPYVGANRYYVAKDTLYNAGILGAVDMCDWQTLGNFLAWSVTYLPAKKYFLILWDHGTGWTLAPRRTFGSDWSAGTEMSIANGDLNRALKTFFEATGTKLSIIGFDACNMQQIEIDYQIKDYAKICLAPQTVWPIHGFPYESILYIFKQNPNISEIELTKEIVKKCREYYWPTISSAISAVNLGKIEDFTNRLGDYLTGIMQRAPESGMKDLRNHVQTISLSNPNPAPEDDYVDLGDFLSLLDGYLPTTKGDILCNMYSELVIANESWGSGLSRVSGITVCFPDRYIEFKNLVEKYLQLDYHVSRWPNFLNWFYDQDDMKPTNVQVAVSDVGRDNDFRLFWTTAFDLSPITYNIVESVDTAVVFADACEDSSNWLFDGFSLVTNFSFNGQGSFFSGNSSNLNNSLTTKANFAIEDMGLLDCHLYYNTEDMKDSLIIEYGTKKYVYYGRSKSWQHCRLVLPSGNSALKILYHSNESINNGGAYIDEIKLFNLVSGKLIRTHHRDTTLYVFNKLKGSYNYGVFSEDAYGNLSDLSNFITVNVHDIAVPYSVPNPFHDDCIIFLDLPDSINPMVYIYSVAGRLIRKFPSSSIVDKKIFWNGKDDNNRDVGAGLYFVIIRDRNFTKIGKIARQR